MSKQITEVKTIFQYHELSESAKEKVRQEHCEHGMHHDWWEFVYEDFLRVAEILGIEVTTRDVKLVGGGTRPSPNIYFSGFWSQGDGACFEGYYGYKAGAAKDIREYAPKDDRLHRIADQLQAAQKPVFYGLNCSITHSGHYHHEFCTNFNFTSERNDWCLNDPELEAEGTITDALRDLMRWLYRQLETDYEYQTSDESIKEMSEANNYWYLEDGTFYPYTEEKAA